MINISLLMFTPIKVGSATIGHRIAMAPMSRLRAVNETPNDTVVEYYKQRSQHPGTLVITEGTIVSPEGSGFPNVPGIWSQDQVEAWKPVADAIHANGSTAFMQIAAIGRVASVFPDIIAAKGFDIVGASPVAIAGKEAPRELTVAELQQYVQAFAMAASNAIAAGFDGIELHAGNGFLLNQFLDTGSNRRTDQYGGSLENRNRFVLQVVEAVVLAIGAERVAIRLSPWNEEQDMTAGNVEQYAALLDALPSLAYVHVIEARYDVSKVVPHHQNDFVREHWEGVLVRAGGFKDPREISEFVAKDPKLVVAMGRYFVSNPDLVNKLQQQQELAEYDRATFYWDGSYDMAKGYTREFAKTV